MAQQGDQHQVHAAGLHVGALSGCDFDWPGLEARTAVQEWTGTAGELWALAHEQAIEPWTGSPLLYLEPDGAAPAAAVHDSFGAALLRLAQPELLLDAFHVPPPTGVFARFYGRVEGEWYACHWSDDRLQHVAWPIQAAWLEQFFLSFVEVAREAPPVGVRLTCDRAGFEALLALVDLFQQESLVALLEGRTSLDLVLDGKDLLAAHLRPRAERDLRWMVTRGRRMAPIPLAPAVPALEDALARFGRSGWTRRTESGWRVETRLRMACALMAPAGGWFAASRRVRHTTPEGGIVWRREHGAVLRGLDSLWTFAFSDFSQHDFRVDLGDAAPDDVRAFTGRLLVPLPSPREAGFAGPARGAARRATPPPLPQSEAAGSDDVEWYYAQDGQAVGPFSRARLDALVRVREIDAATPVWNQTLPGWASAAEAGLVARVHTPPPPPPGTGPRAAPAGVPHAAAPPPAVKCVACGTRLRPDVKFCTQCGAPLTG